MFKFLNFILPKKIRNKKLLIANVRLSGVIGDVNSFKSGLSLSVISDTLDKAFGIKNVKAVTISINSPGGSPVQSSLIHDYIRELSKKHKVPVYTFAEDIAASGGYWLLCAGDEMYAHETSIIGSIGVIMATFGLDKLISRWGIDRRIYTSGKNKSKFDMFVPEKQEDLKLISETSNDIHEVFKKHVRDRRKNKLIIKDEEIIFNGDFWSGKRALKYGLIDGIGNIYSVMKNKFGSNIYFKNISIKKSLLKKIFNSNMSGLIDNKSIGTGIAHELIEIIEKKYLLNKFGL